MYGLITTWAYYGRINVSPEILNNFVAPNMENIDLKN